MKDAAAPKMTKTNEKPNVNKIMGNKLIFFFSNISSNVLPEIYAIYPGMRGNTQGDKKLINPAPKANKTSIMLASIFNSC